ncbi:hypothetical protein TSTA_023020 [Talaromyces stipitatus ATCC 10500]|uniref:Uncharacterized protein n=1 Tax=Talaromyces stipitatus (strain ATCC 10500 / CBS 375.48 / QM 6759 / NRRL 1006) TaxID=441959 RepID=B8MEW5_TALSN|nr:uncharacterized protein TSTA_023020 [Talaromyces stipitatus ATCC 10500]EED17248.1 hypothetical protein TSTA_023020 [Talaromyces stipitatus ATCC 10500]
MLPNEEIEEAVGSPSPVIEISDEEEDNHTRPQPRRRHPGRPDYTYQDYQDTVEHVILAPPLRKRKSEDSDAADFQSKIKRFVKEIQGPYEALEKENKRLTQERHQWKNDKKQLWLQIRYLQRQLDGQKRRNILKFYRPSHLVQPISKRQYTDGINAVNEPITPKSPILECEIPETEDALESMICVDAAELRSAYEHESKPDVHSTTLVMHGEDLLKSENIDYSTMPICPDGEQVESPPVPEEDLTKGLSFLDTVYQMVDIVHLLKKHPSDLPRTVHQSILQSLRTNQGPIIDSTVSHWSDGKMWMKVLERGSATNRRCTVLNMLEYMGASKWYDGQIELARRTVCTKDNKAVGEKGAAMHVMNRITDEHSLLSRKVIINQFSRGKRLRVLVEEIRLGILISPKIW